MRDYIIYQDKYLQTNIGIVDDGAGLKHEKNSDRFKSLIHHYNIWLAYEAPSSILNQIQLRFQCFDKLLS